MKKKPKKIQLTKETITLLSAGNAVSDAGDSQDFNTRCTLNSETIYACITEP